MANITFGGIPMKDTGDFIESEQYQRLISQCENPMVRMAIVILWNSGRRIEEITGGMLIRKMGTIYCPGLKPCDIDRENRLVSFFILKKKTMGLVKKPKPVSESFIAELSDYVSTHNIAPDMRIIPRTRQWFDLQLKALSDRTGIRTISGRRLHAHCFRHSWNAQASKLAEKPEDIAIQKEYMEHSSENITMSYYMNFGNTRARKLIDRMAGKEDNNEP